MGEVVNSKKGFYEKYVKRPQDIVISIIAIVLLSPVMILTSLLVKLFLGSPVLFRQKRPGLNENIFTMYKFRTMTDRRNDKGELLSDAERLTKFGLFMRKTSLDELPELFNILKGDMSFVGPRPLLVQYLPLYNEVQKHRHDVRPGLTGLAQVRGRNAISWTDKFKLDIEYASDIKFISDWKLIFLTVGKVFAREGITSSNSVTMEVFKGNNEN